MRIRPWIEVEDFFRKRGLSDDEIFGYKGEYFNRVAAELGKDPEDEELEKQRKLFLYGNEKEWELFKAAKSGLIRGLGEVPDTAADVIEFGQKLIPGESQSVENIETRLRETGEGIREKAGPFQPSSMPERITSGLSMAPGVVASMAPFGAAATAAVTAGVAAAPVAIPAAVASVAAGALGFGAYEAIRNVEGTPADMLKGGLKGAALGGILGTAGSLTKGIGRGSKTLSKAGVKGKLAGMGAAGVGAGAFEAAMGAPPEQVAETAATFALLSTIHKNEYNKVARALGKSGITDKQTVDLAFDTKRQVEAENYELLKRQKEDKRTGKKSVVNPTTPLIKASDVAAETKVPFELITGGFEWSKRIKRTRNESPGKADLYERLRKKIVVLNMQREAAKSEPGAVDSNGDLSEGFRRYWDAKYQELIRPRQMEIRGAPDERVGAEYTVFDHTGRNPIFTIERVDWNKKSPNQWRVVSATNPRSNATFFKSLTEAEQSLKGVLNADPAMPASAAFTRGLSLASSDNRMLRMFGRNLMALGAKNMGRHELASALKPISIDDAMRLSAEELDIPLGQALIKDRGKFSVKYNNVTMANLKDAETFFHEIGHYLTKSVLMHRNKGKNVEYITDQDLASMFTPDEMGILHGAGIKEYTPRGETEPMLADGSSYPQEGISAYFRVKLKGLDPKTNLPDLFANSEAGLRLQAKLDSWLSGIDPENPANIERIPGLGDRMSRVAQIWDRYRQQNPQQITEAMTSGTRGGLLTQPIRELGRAIQQAWFSDTKRGEDVQKLLHKESGFSEIPDERNIEYLKQFISGSSAGQMGRGGMVSGKIITPTGTIEFKPLPEAIAEAGFSMVRGRGAQERLLNEYVLASRLAETKRQIMLYDESRQAHIDFGRGKKEAAEKGGATPPDPTNQDSKLVPGRKLMSWGEILGTEKEIDQLREKAMAFETENRKYLPGYEVYDPIEHLSQLDKKYPNAHTIIDKWESEFDAARELAHSPVRSGGDGVPSLGPDGSYLYKEDGKTRVKGASDLHGLDLNDIKTRIMKKNARLSTAERIRRNPLLDSNLNVNELPQYMIIGGKTLKAADYWGTGKYISPAVEWTMKLENTAVETNFNRLAHEYYEMIGMQGKGKLNIGSIPDSAAVQEKLKKGELGDIEKEMMVGYRFNGHNVYLQFNPNTPEGIQLFNGIKRTNPLFSGNKFVDIALGGPKRMMVLGTTGANIGFLIYTNAWRDSMTTAIQTKIPERRGFVGVGKTFYDFLPFLFRANKDIIFRGTEEARLRAEARGPEEAARFESLLRYQASPVKGSALIGQDFRSRDSQVSDILMRARMVMANNEGKVGNHFAARQLQMHTISHPIDALRTMMSISEDLNRFPEFYLTEQEMASKGLNPTMQPVSRGAEVSIDFKRAGMYGRVLNDMIPFFNPSLQGVSKFGRVLFDDKTPSLKNVNKHALGLGVQTVTVPSIGLWLIHKDEEWYRELPTWEKLMFWHFKVKDTVLRLPIPFEWGLLMGQLPVMVYDSIYNEAPERVKEQMMIGLRQIVPYGFVDNLPQAIKPAVEAVANKNFFTNIPIETRAMEGRLPWDRSSQGTLGAYKGAGKLASLLHAPELFQSPVMLEHLTRGYFGSVVNGLISDLEAIVTLDPSKSKGGMLFSRMVSNTDRPGQSVQDFYTKLDEMDKPWKTAKRLIESGDKTTAAKVLNKYKSKLGLTAEDIRRIILRGDTSTPPELLKMHQARLKMAELKKEEEDKAMTETAQAILGRDWD